MYLDYAATTPIHPSVLETMFTVMEEEFGNPSSVHRFGRKARYILDSSKTTLATSIGAKENEIIITSGGSESNNLAIFGVINQLPQNAGKHIITTQIEHASVQEPMSYLETQGFEVTYLSTKESGSICLDELQQAIRPDTVLLSIMMVNNETGVIIPIKEISTLIRKQNPTIVFHTDAVQAYETQTIDVSELGVDLLSTSAHKISGPKGVGFLFKRQGCKIESLVMGGEQEENKRAGTENIAGIAGFASAVKIMQNPENHVVDHIQALRDTFLRGITGQVAFEINGDNASKAPHILNIWFPGIPSNLLIPHLDLAGIAISAGSACSSGSVKSSHVLVSMFGSESPRNTESVRVSFGPDLAITDIENATKILIQTISKIQDLLQKEVLV
ncbi:cysteine desulfurase family protein [Paenilisteria rocourtiae]|uniref:cysteine desulfurase n=1 Tax=Listeria rocourtiae TaxID=647910 RepID=A0A4R6ZLI7_9LIST|nr:cysteine desulfurase family protein [Listeria rocourtiae]MBC1434968.1 cysteine desulfurase [Listeria rocourtiae]MBC1604782.1 cysteine desulfurase [Listeria rocourtiae]TDR53132.1 cysteine desulfurase [Listeria rocourtiae]